MSSQPSPALPLEERLYYALRDIAVIWQDERIQHELDGSPLDWKARSMKQERIARAATQDYKDTVALRDTVSGDA